MAKTYKSFKELQAKMSPERRAANRARAMTMSATMALDELREARRLTQAQLASTMEKDQGTISKLEHQTDMYVSTLRNFVEAMGGQLHIVADFPDGSAEIELFEKEVTPVKTRKRELAYA